MASFFQDLWESIFTPGPTPTLLIATNVTFGCLQLLLFILLIATYSIHFVILSALCGCLWWGINWFAAELQTVKRQEEEDKKAKKEDPPTGEDSETEVESTSPPTKLKTRKNPGSDVEPVEPIGEVRARAAAAANPSSSQGTQSSASTEDEWEKVSENEKDK